MLKIMNMTTAGMMTSVPPSCLPSLHTTKMIGTHFISEKNACTTY